VPGAPASFTHAEFECIVVTITLPTIRRKSQALRRGRALHAGTRRSGARAECRRAYGRGDILYFIDADVCVQPDTLARIATAFDADPRLDALIVRMTTSGFARFLSHTAI